MAGSRRRLKRNAPKVRVGIVKRTKHDKTRIPVEVSEQRTALEDRLQHKPDWTQQKTLSANYAANKLVLDANEGFGRNAAAAGSTLLSAEERAARGEDHFEDDDELRAATGLERKTGKAAPPRLTTTQRQMIERLISKHGQNTQAMVLDIKNNPMQHSAGRLAQLIAGHQYWSGRASDKHDFRGPNKPYKKL